MAERVGHLLRHPLRHRLLLEYAGEPDSPARVARRLGQPLNVVSYHTAVLLRHRLLELVRTERRRGALSRFYRATVGTVIEDADWSALATELRRELASGTLEQALDEARRAARDGGFDGADAHLTRSPLELDEEGRAAIADRLRATIDELESIAAASRRRTPEPAIALEVVLLGFEPAPPHSSYA